MIELLSYIKPAENEEGFSFYKPYNGATVIKRGKQELAIICDRCEPGLHYFFDPFNPMYGNKKIKEYIIAHPSLHWKVLFLCEAEMAEFIKNDPEEAFYKSIYKIDDNHFVLNLSCCYDDSPMDETSDEYTKFIRERTLLFQPIIEKFLDEGVVE